MSVADVVPFLLLSSLSPLLSSLSSLFPLLPLPSPPPSSDVIPPAIAEPRFAARFCVQPTQPSSPGSHSP